VIRLTLLKKVISITFWLPIAAYSFGITSSQLIANIWSDGYR
jgi:hypothetical protein